MEKWLKNFLTASMRSLISDSISWEPTRFKPSFNSSNVIVPLLSVSIILNNSFRPPISSSLSLSAITYELVSLLVYTSWLVYELPSYIYATCFSIHEYNSKSHNCCLISLSILSMEVAVTSYDQTGDTGSGECVSLISHLFRPGYIIPSLWVY